MYFVFPLAIFGLSLASVWAVVAVVVVVAIIVIFVITINVMQSKVPHKLPESMRTWEFLPKPLRSLEPYDRLFKYCGKCCKRCKCCQDEDEESSSVTGSNETGPSTSLPSYDQVTKNEGYENRGLELDETSNNEKPPVLGEVVSATTF